MFVLGPYSFTPTDAERTVEHFDAHADGVVLRRIAAAGGVLYVGTDNGLVRMALP